MGDLFTNVIKDTVEELDFSGCKITDQAKVNTIINFVRTFKNLTTLKVEHNKLSDELLDQLFNGILEHGKEKVKNVYFTSFLTSAATKEKFTTKMKDTGIAVY